MALNDVYGRLKSLLESLARPNEAAELLVRERLTHEALSQRLGCSRGMVSRLLKDLEVGGYVQQRPQGLVLVKPLPPKW
jgi:CRP/FNR family transcriptional regulator, cyclic AMP receptor protein